MAVVDMETRRGTLTERVGAVERSVAEIRGHIEPIAAMKPALDALVGQRERELEQRAARDRWLKRGAKSATRILAVINGAYIVGRMFGWWG